MNSRAFRLGAGLANVDSSQVDYPDDKAENAEA